MGSSRSTKRDGRLCQQISLLINPRFVKLIANEENEIIALFIAMDDISEGIKNQKVTSSLSGYSKFSQPPARPNRSTCCLGPSTRATRDADWMSGWGLVWSNQPGTPVGRDGLPPELEYNTKVRAEMEKFAESLQKFRIFQRDI